MGISLKKIILTIAAAVLSVIAFGWVIMMQNHATLVRNRAGDETLKLDEVAQTLEDIDSGWNIIERRIRERYKVDATLSALALRNVIENNKEEAVALYSNGAVIGVEDGEIKAPEGIVRKFGLEADLFKGRYGLFQSPANENTLIVYGRISSGYYYVEWHEDTSIRKEAEESLDIPGILRKAEAAYGVYALCAAKDPDAEGGERILYSSDIFTDLEDSFADTLMQDLSAEGTDAGIPGESGTMSLHDGSFRYVKSPVPEIDGYLVLLSIQPNLYVKALSQGTYMFTALILFLAGLITSGFSLYSFIRNNELTPVLEKRYQPSGVRRFAILCGVIGTVLIFLSGLLIYALNELYDDTARGKERLRMVEESLDMYSGRAKQNMERFTDIYLDYGVHIAELLNHYPELREKSVLETLADSISASSITLYDADGNETVSSSEYIGLTLGRGPEWTTYDFRRILKGVPSIVHGAETDEITGRSEIRAAVRITDDADPERYGALMISVDPGLLSSDYLQMTDSVLKNLSGEDVILCIASPESGEILFSGREDLAGRDISALGLNSGELQGSIIRNVETDEGSMFITSAALSIPGTGSGLQASEKPVAIYAARGSSFTAGMLYSALAGSLMFAVIYAVITWLVLGGYTDAYFEQNRRLGRPLGNKWKNWQGIRNYVRTVRPEKIGLITMELVIALYLTQQIPISNFNTAPARNSVYYYLNSGQWEKGLNLFALAGIFLLLGQILLCVILIRILLGICSSFAGQKGKTIFRLIRSLISYLALFTFLILALTYIGISMAAILTVIGTLGIALSLGAQHFVSDIIAGLTMVFEGTVHAGDIVDLGVGVKLYHGEVREIGLRFISLQTLDGNIVTLSNRDINMTTNMTRLNSRCTIEFTVSSEYPIEEIEEMLQRELPKIGEMDRRILNGPVYNGIIALEGGSMTLLVTAECREEDLAGVQLVINRSLQRIFTQNGYRI